MNYKPILTRYGYYYTEPEPTKEEINKFYEEEFYLKPKTYINDSSLEVRDKDSDFYNFWYDFYINIINDNNENIDLINESLIDLGCGYGHFLKYVKDSTSIKKLKGVEPFPEFLEYVEAQKIEGEISTLEDFVSNSHESYNIVTMINVLEHLRNPKKVLTEINNNILNDDGLLLIQVPNDFNIIQKIAVKKNKCHDWWFTPPQHLSYFSPSSLENLLKACGFSEMISYCSFPIDMFLLMGTDYIKDPKLGRDAHLKRLSFEKSFLEFDGVDELKKIYHSFAKAEIGREIICIARK